jgi:hypothetical protein
MPDIYWLIAAQRRFQNATATAMTAAIRAELFRMICERLAATFSKADAVIVRDRLEGYRRHAERHILLVEVIHRTEPLRVTVAGAVLDSGSGGAQAGDAGSTCKMIWPDFCRQEQCQPTQTSAHVVKLAFKIADNQVSDDPKVLSDELDAWEKCRPVGMTHDSILMRLRCGARGPNREVLSIVYDDAHHVIGMGLLSSLEDAVIDCCAWGTPTVSSIELLVRVLYERLGMNFYARSQVIEKPAGNLAKLQAWRTFDTWLDTWQDSLNVGDEPQLDRLRIRREVLGMLSYRRNCLIDPVDYLRSVKECPRFCPLLLWGCSHGDLHGRNMLVSVLDDDVTLPAVFDYADMGLENLVGWDFVKLETELKVRVLAQLLEGPETDYLFTVLKFECFLAACSLAIHNQEKPPEAAFKPEGLNRLAAILVAIRRQAQRHLGVQRLRDRQWLEEYYFLLACHGVYAGLFDTYKTDRRQLAAVYISAGVAARQLARPNQGLNALIRAAEIEAQELKDHPPTGFDPGVHKLPRAECEMSYHARLGFAKKWVDSKDPRYIEGAIGILKQLREEYPHVLEIEDELALAYLEAKKPQDFERLLAEVNARYGQLSEEFLCRIGRFWKDKGDQERTIDREGARRSYETSLEWYLKAYAIRSNYYPGINLADLQFILGRTDEARQTAESVLRSLAGSPPAGELGWILATQADAQLILGNHPEAERLYQQARKQVGPRGTASMRRQVEILLAYAAQSPKMIEYWNTAKLNEVFNPSPSKDTATVTRTQE